MKKEKELAKYLKECREHVGLTQKEVSEKMGYGTAQFISNWENGIVPPIRQLKKIAKLYKINPDKLFEFILHGDLARLEARLRRHYNGEDED